MATLFSGAAIVFSVRQTAVLLVRRELELPPLSPDWSDYILLLSKRLTTGLEARLICREKQNVNSQVKDGLKRLNK